MVFGLDDAGEATLRAAVAVMLPADGWPGGWESGPAGYFARHERGDLAPYGELIGRGVAALGREWPGFSALPPPDQAAALAAMEDAGNGGRRFVHTLARLVAEAAYADPGNGGNPGAWSWEMIGYRAGPAVPYTATLTPELTTTRLAAVGARYDAIVVGAGAGGGVVACLLAEAGASVLLLERGEWLDRDTVGRDHLRNHRYAAYGHNTGPELEGNPRVVGDTAGAGREVPPYHGDYHNNAMTVGGGTRVFGAQAWRFHPDDFAMATRYGVPAGSALVDWPFGYEELAPYYERAEWEFGVAGAPGAPEHGPMARGFPIPPVAPNPESRLLEVGAAKLGISTQPVPLLINTEPYGGRQACVQCGECVGFACPAEAKNGTHNTVIPRALATGRCTLVTGAMATHIQFAGRRATGVEVVDVAEPSVARTIGARVVVVAAGAIESARLLMLSGAGNENDQLGRHLQGHTYTGAFGMFEGIVKDGIGPGVSIASRDYSHGNDGFVGGGMLANDFIKLPIQHWAQALPPETPRWGAASKAAMRHGYARTTHVMGPVHEIPYAGARVSLARGVGDRLGLPVARLEGTVHPETLRTGEFLRARAEDWLRASGAVRTWSYPVEDRLNAGQHQAGTCRMGKDPRTSVCDPWGRVHGYEGLFVADGSLHPTNGSVNPVLTILANAYRIGERLSRDG